MAANTTPIFTLTPIIGKANVGTANTARDGTGTLATILTGATAGTRIVRITITATVTTTAGMVRLFIGDDAGTPVIHLWREVNVSAVTVSASMAGFSSTISLSGESSLILPANYTLRASTHNAENFTVIAEAGAY